MWLSGKCRPPPPPPPHAGGRQRGFTLLELTVATILFTIVMTAVYSSFRSAINAWKLGEENLTTFQDARIALSMMTRELQCTLAGTEPLFSGDHDSVEFYTVAPPMNPDDGEGARVLCVTYRFNRQDHTVRREERRVEGPMPTGAELAGDAVKLANPYRSVIARNVREFKLTYKWVPPIQSPPSSPPPRVEPLNHETNPKGHGLPQAIAIMLTLDDVNSESGQTSFSTAAVFRSPTTPYNQAIQGGFSP